MLHFATLPQLISCNGNWTRDTALIDRRLFLATGLASAVLGTTPALAHKKGEEYVLPEDYQPTLVRLKTRLPAGEIHVDPATYRLFLTLPKRKAIRYTVGIGRGNLYHPGVYHVGAKQEWPRWIPTDDMVKRNPEVYGPIAEAGGMDGGINNPLGARALYLYDAKGRDTYLRIHGTNNPRTIGVAVSNGCARLINPHVIELYDKVPIGTKVVLYPKPGNVGVHS